MLNFTNKKNGQKTFIPDSHAIVCSKLENGNYEVMVALVGNWKPRKMNVTMQRLQQMEANFNESMANGIKLLFDYDHKSYMGVDSKAAGWGISLSIREDKLYCEIEPTEAGRAAIEGNEFCYLSPVFDYRWENHITGEIREDWKLDSVALTNIPYLTELPSIKNDKTMEESQMEWWKELGYTSEEEAIKAHKQNQTDLAAANAKVLELTAANDALSKTNKEQLAASNVAVVEAAILSKKILPGQKDVFVKLINSDRALFDEAVAANSGVVAGAAGLGTEAILGETPIADMLSTVTSYKQLLDDGVLSAAFEKAHPTEFKVLYERWMKEHK
jgi:phage I-like protein